LEYQRAKESTAAKTNVPYWSKVAASLRIGSVGRHTLTPRLLRGASIFMGHQRLGTLPRSKLWRDVVELIDHRADVEEVAAATSLAAEQSMIDASQDAAVQHAFYLIAKIPLAAREHEFEAALSALGIPIRKGPLLADIVSGLMEAIDARTRQIGGRSDYGEIAQLSAAEALYAVIGRETRDLFGVDAVTTQSAIAGFATVKQFAVLARDFFSRLTRRHIDYYLSRELSKHVGPGRRFPSVREHRLFEDALDLHCREATRVIKEYSGEWLSKHNYEGGIDPAKAGRFVSYAAQKIRGELRYRRNARVIA
jgi:hypothetical protein